jgi:hypothetical protein
MASGGARNRSGPQPSETSARSDRRGIRFTSLPAAGYDGPVPEFPLPKRIVWVSWFEDGRKVRENDEGATESVADREAELWAWAWQQPQAWAWSQSSESWRLHTVAMWVRTYVLCESSEATAADKGSLHRFADQIGLTPAGLKENGWAIARDELAEKAATRSEPQSRRSSRDRMKMVSGGGG